MSALSFPVRPDTTAQTSAPLTDVTELTRAWAPPQEQTTLVATVLWSMTSLGFVLNVGLLLKYLRTKWYLLPLPPPAIVINLCVSNLLLVLNVLLSAMTLTINLEETEVKIGRFQLFLAICVLLQSWIGLVMLASCNSKVQEQRTHLVNADWHQYVQQTTANIDNSEQLVNSRPLNPRQRVYRPYRRQSRTPLTAAQRTSTHPSGSGETVASTGKLVSVTRKKSDVKLWLAWAWLLSVLAAMAFLMTMRDGQDVCLTLDPFRSKYLLTGVNIYLVKVSEDGLLKIPLLLVMVPAYLLGSVIIIKGVFHIAFRRACGDCSWLPGDIARKKRERKRSFSILKPAKHRRLDRMNPDKPVPTEGQQFAFNSNVNALQNHRHGMPRGTPYNYRKEIITLAETPETSTTQRQSVQQDGSNERGGRCLNATDFSSDSESIRCRNREEWSGSRVSRDEQAAAYLPFIDDGATTETADDLPPNDVKFDAAYDLPPNNVKSREPWPAEKWPPLENGINHTSFKQTEHFKDSEINCSTPAGVSSFQARPPSSNYFSGQNTSGLKEVSKPHPGCHQTGDRTEQIVLEPQVDNDSRISRQHEDDGHNLSVPDPGHQIAADRNKKFQSEKMLREEDSTPQQPHNQNNDENNSANKNPFHVNKTEEIQEARCLEGNGRLKSTDTDSVSSSGDSSSLNDRLHQLYSTASSPVISRRCLAAGQSAVLRTSEAVRGREADGVNIVSSSMHHFTVQGRLAPIDRFQLNPSTYGVGLCRIYSLPHPTYEHQISRKGSARSRLSNRVSYRSFTHRDDLQDLSTHRQPLHPLIFMQEQLSTWPDPIAADQHRGTELETTYEEQLREEDAKHGVPCGQESNPHSPSQLRLVKPILIGPKEASCNALPASLSPDASLFHSSRQDHGRQVSFAKLSHGTPLSLQQDPSRASQSQTAASGPPERIYHEVKDFGDVKRAAAKGGGCSSWAVAGEESLEIGRALCRGDEKRSAPGWKKEGQTKLWTISRCLSCCRDVSYRVKILVGILLHVMLCLPFALSLAPGIWSGKDCGIRLQTLLVTRLLLFCHVISCPLWLLCFHGYTFTGKKTMV